MQSCSELKCPNGNGCRFNLLPVEWGFGLEEQEEFMMKQSTQRTIFRLIHLVFSIPILGYVYSPFDKLPDYAPLTRFVFIPVMVLTGLWMWKGHVVRRLISRQPVQQR
jgi:hypothetical protein